MIDDIYEVGEEQICEEFILLDKNENIIIEIKDNLLRTPSDVVPLSSIYRIYFTEHALRICSHSHKDITVDVAFVNKEDRLEVLDFFYLLDNIGVQVMREYLDPKQVFTFNEQSGTQYKFIQDGYLLILPGLDDRNFLVVKVTNIEKCFVADDLFIVQYKSGKKVSRYTNRFSSQYK